MRSSSNSSIAEGNDPIRIAVVGQAGVGKSALVVRYLTRRFIWEYDPTLECVYKHQACVDGKMLNVEILDTGAAYDSQDRYCSDAEGQLRWADGVLLVYSVTDRCSFDVAASLAHRLRSGCLGRPSNRRCRYKHNSGGSNGPDSDPDDSSSTSSSDEVDSSTTLQCGGTSGTAGHRCVVIVGNKCDLATERRVSEAEGIGLAVELGTSGSGSAAVDPALDRTNGNLAVDLKSSAFVETSARDGGPEIAAAFEAVCRQVVEQRRAALASTSSGQRSPVDVPASLRGSCQSLVSNKGRFARKLVLLQAVNRLVRKLHV